ncbi:MAG: ROK family protein [Lentisphaeria bacterium]|nr:ROK family protein [Lentisphaeria bacterium]
MNDDLALGIDLGGTKLYAVVTDGHHNCLGELKADTDSNATPEKLAQDILELGRNVLEQNQIPFGKIQHFGLAVPSPVDPVNGNCYHATNLNWKNAALKEMISQKLERPVYLGNDANLGLLAEFHCGAAKGFSTVVGYFIGTGLGGGVIINGKLHHGNTGLAGELGHMIVKYNGRKCGCGHRGCAEAYCSKIAFVKAIKKAVFKHGLTTSIPLEKLNEETRNIKSKHLAKAYKAGDEVVCRVIDKGAVMLGVAAAGVTAAIAPECIILGGGVISALGKEFLPVFRESFAEHLFGLPPEKIKICCAGLGDRAVATGATLLARAKGDL